MRQNSLFRNNRSEEKCIGTSCLKCLECKVKNMGERGEELKNNFTQLYAKEAEHYFFYYGLNTKQA
jgi:hypothetical protein